MLISRLTAVAACAITLSVTLTARAAAQSPTLMSMGQPINGISCDAMEGQRLHIHQHITILDHGKSVDVPPNVGQAAGRGCLYWIHTHTPDGIIHIEAPKDRSFTLGDFFDIWGQPLTKSEAASAHAAKGQHLKVWVDGKAYDGDPRAIKLAAHTDILVEAGPPFPKVALFTDWNGR